MRSVVPIIAVFMTYFMTPGAFELTEHAVHLLRHGDTAHAADDAHADDGASDEHGCSGPYHACTCHQSVTFVPPAATLGTSAVARVSRSAEPRSADAVDSGYSNQLYRPPRA